VSDAEVRIERVAVLGAGVMGAAIAQVFATAGVEVSIFDPQSSARDSVLERVRAGCVIVGVDATPVLGRVSVRERLDSAVATADLVIEAGPENLGVKRSIFESVEPLVSPRTILASNTSAIPIGEIMAGVSRQDRVLGTHFWNPPYLVPLVEVVKAAMTAENYVRAVVDVMERARLKPVRVEVDVPGFVGNRLQHALKREAIAIVAAGICSAETVDTVVRYGFGARLAAVGPLEQSDLSGLELTLAIQEVLMPFLDVTPVPHPYLIGLIERGDTGARSGRGFREWQPGEADARRTEITAALVAARKEQNEHDR
jgi:3-hydroxybutyryl-CoA dehydrogenase